jgi:hypothetical protein
MIPTADMFCRIDRKSEPPTAGGLPQLLDAGRTRQRTPRRPCMNVMPASTSFFNPSFRSCSKSACCIETHKPSYKFLSLCEAGMSLVRLWARRGPCVATAYTGMRTSQCCVFLDGRRALHATGIRFLATVQPACFLKLAQGCSIRKGVLDGLRESHQDVDSNLHGSEKLWQNSAPGVQVHAYGNYSLVKLQLKPNPLNFETHFQTSPFKCIIKPRMTINR